MKIKNIALLLTLSTISLIIRAENPTLSIRNNRTSPITIIVEKYNTSGSITGLATSTQEKKIKSNTTEKLGFIPHWKRKLDGCVAMLNIKPEGFLSAPINLEKVLEKIMQQEHQHPNKNCTIIINTKNQSSEYPITIGWE